VQGGIEIAELSPIVIPVFVSHLGCPHRCIFCDQRQFSEPVLPEDIPDLVRAFIAGCKRSHDRKRLVAFYGGSFTGIDSLLLKRYLAKARELVEQGIVHGVKASTRPDMVTYELLSMCKKAGFVEMEIGAQSMDDTVLHACRRGHGSADTVRAARIIKDAGMRLGIQIMPGLPGEDRKSFRHTVEEVASLHPDVVRIYPTVIIKGTALEQLYRLGDYRPLDLEEALDRCLFGYIRFSQEGCRVLRMGIPQPENVSIVAGPSHPSFGFLVKARAYRIMAEVLMERYGTDVRFEVHPLDILELLGYKRENIRDLCFSYSFDHCLPRGYIRVKGESDKGCLQPRDIIEYIL